MKMKLGSICRTFGGAVAIVAAGYIFNSVALGQVGGGAASTCRTTLWNGQVQSIECEPVASCNNRDYNDDECFGGKSPSMSCRRICNIHGQVTGGECICVCSTTKIDEPNCPTPQQ